MIEGALIAAVLVTLTTASLWLHRLMTKDGKTVDPFEESLGQASRELGITFEPVSRRSSSAAGTLGDLAVRVALITEKRDEQDGSYIVVSVEGPRIPRGLSFFAESGRGEDVLTGDPVFDDEVEVHGQPSVVLALLKRELRLKVAIFVGTEGRLEAGRLTCRTRAPSSPWEILSLLRLTVVLAHDLSSSEDGSICQRLARNALSDPLPGVRLWNLLQLHDEFAGTGEARETSRAALADSSPWVRLAAARFLVDEGLEVLEALARGRETPDQAALEAVALLAARLPVERAGPLLVDVLKGRSGDARRQAVEELGRLRYRQALGPLIVLMERADPRSAAAAAAALGSLGDARAESSLLASVESEAHELRLAAAKALGSLGSVRSVQPLLTLLDSRRLDAAGRQCVRDAVAGIQSRLVGADAGQLSLAASGAESGRLSLVKPTAGAGDLSLSPED